MKKFSILFIGCLFVGFGFVNAQNENNEGITEVQDAATIRIQKDAKLTQAHGENTVKLIDKRNTTSEAIEVPIAKTAIPVKEMKDAQSTESKQIEGIDMNQIQRKEVEIPADKKKAINSPE